MKRSISLILIMLLVFSFVGCKKQTQFEFSSFGLSDFELQELANSTETEIPAESSEPSINVSDNQSQKALAKAELGTPSSVPAETAPTVICAHEYRKIAVGVSCNSSGYMQYTCTKCGLSYKGESVPAGHDFGKYLCEMCGKIDPESNVFWGMNAFLSKYGTPNGKGNMNCYPNDSSLIMISNNLDQKQFYVSYEDAANGEIISVRVHEGYSSITFLKNSNCGFMDIKNSAFSFDNKIVFDEFSVDPSDPVDVDVFATECAAKLKILFQRAENEILTPKTGLTFKSFGFRI